MYFKQPSARELKFSEWMLSPWRRWTRPHFRGMENVPDERPLLFVGNHTLYGILDVPFLFFELYREHGIFLRSLAHKFHYRVPGWRDALSHFGAVEGTRENCGALMDQGECVLVFPGGGREVSKRKGEKYELIWGERLGFVKMAIQHQCTIVPFASVGVEDMFDIIFDGHQLMRSPLGPLLEELKLHPELMFPISKGMGPTPLPRPERIYMQIMEPIQMAPFDGCEEDEEVLRQVRGLVHGAISRGIDELKHYRETDPHRYLDAIV